MSYHDLVIKDGKFIGKFEELYTKYEDPWNQSQEWYINQSPSRAAVCTYIDKYKISSMIEFGCGLGHTTNLINKNTNIDILGVDISETSIKKAKENYPDIGFKIDDIENICDYNDYEAFFFSEITWYLLENNKIGRIFDLMRQKLKGKFFIHNLVFYKSNQKYGLENFSNLNEFLKFCPFNLLGTVSSDYAESNTIETSTIFEI